MDLEALSASLHTNAYTDPVYTSALPQDLTSACKKPDRKTII